MADYQVSQREAQPQENETVLLSRMIRVIDEERTMVVEHGLRLVEPNPVLAFVLGMLLLIPLKTQFRHVNVL